MATVDQDPLEDGDAGRNDDPSTTRIASEAAPGHQRAVKRRLTDILLEQGSITQEQLDVALEQMQSGIEAKLDIITVLVKLGYIDDEKLAKARAAQLGLRFAGLDLYGPISDIPDEILALIPEEHAVAYHVLPVGLSHGGRALKVVAGHWTKSLYDVCKTQIADASLKLDPLIGSDKAIKSAIRRYYINKNNPNMSNGTPNKPISAVPAVVDPRRSRPAFADRRASDVLSAAANPEIAFAGQKVTQSDEDVDIVDFSVDQPAIIQMVYKLIADAIHHRASDIHFEPQREGIIVKYRVDGTLIEWDRVPKGFANACTSRLKVMAEMNIAERRVPQDGRITVRTAGRSVDMRVSSLPTQYGEAIVLRILDRTSMRLDVNHLGFGERNLSTLHNLIKRPHGIFLATGPTGSGKTTTLYAAIHAIQSPEINIITVEDPIEYELVGIRQSNTNEKAGLTFAKQLRAILRQDPDVIYVGEIRDPETAEIAFRAALTGHLVFSTLHCNEASAAITRLLNMGMDPFLIASSVIGVMAQRLVRKVCNNCAAPYTPRVDELGLLGLDANSDEVRNANFRMGAGCEKCNGSGFSGRCSVQEVMVMDEGIRELTLERATSTKIRQIATTTGANPMISMRRDAAMKVMQGLTTCEEVQKRVMLDDD
ncbi:MAG: ATPase, T2SS/T4P/T4SS family [Capsulimonadaceae bacterium]|nr:ATPase, T2SS/T4P/T4SS family [Capsulimonadaceae bacterium]